MIRAVPDHYPGLRAAPLHPVIEWTVWLDGQVLGTLDVLDGWTITDKEGDQVRGDLTCSVARTPGTDPAGWAAPTGKNGQTIRARVGLRAPKTRTPVAWVDLGCFRIVSSTPRADRVDLRAAGPLHLVEQARFTLDPVPLPSQSIRGRAVWMVQDLVPVTIDPRLVDRTVPAHDYTGRDRLAHFLDVLEAWPAVAEPDGPGILIRPPYERDGTTPELTYADGEGGTLVDVAGIGGEEMPPNAIIASNDTGSVQGTAVVDVGPWRYGGPAGRRPEFYASPLLTTVQQCINAAIARLGREQRGVSRVKATVVTDLRLMVGSIVRVTSSKGGGTDAVCRVSDITHTRAQTEFEGAALSGVVDGRRVEGTGITTTAGLTPLSEIGAGRVTIPVGDTGTWSDRRSRWRTDTTHLIVGRNTTDSTGGYAWWGRTPAGLPGTLVAGSIDLIRDDLATGDKIHTLTVTPQLIAGTHRGTGKPVVLSTANETISLTQAKPGEERRAVSWAIPNGWLARIDSGEAGGLGLIGIDQDPGTISSAGSSLTLRLDWRK